MRRYEIDFPSHRPQTKKYIQREREKRSDKHLYLINIECYAMKNSVLFTNILGHFLSILKLFMEHEKEEKDNKNI